MDDSDRDPSLPMDWRYGPFSVCFVEKGVLINYTSVNMWIKYPDFIAVLHELTVDVAHKLSGLPISLDEGEGLSLRDGPWWYRIVHPAPIQEFTLDNGQSWTQTVGPLQKGNWNKLSDFETFQRMRGDFMEARKPGGSWLEIYHALQKYRDMKGGRPMNFRRRGPVVVDGSKAPEQNVYEEVDDDDGPGPSVFSSPTQLSLLDLGSPAMAMPSMAPVNTEPAQFSFNHQTLRLPPPSSRGVGKVITGQSILNRISDPVRLDPALDFNQSTRPQVGHLSGAAFASRRSRPAQAQPNNITVPSPYFEIASDENDLSAPAKPTAAEGSPKTPRTVRRNTIQNIKRKAAQRAARKSQNQQEDMDKEREKVKEIIVKQRDERMKRAEKRSSLGG